MRRGAQLAAVAGYLALGACNAGYSEPPTFCDDWCNATHGFDCDYDPAGCVSNCETALARSPYDCNAELGEVADCFRAHPGEVAKVCNNESYQGPCGEARYALNDCAGGARRGYSDCYELCIYLGTNSCPPPSDLEDCPTLCAATGQGLPQCIREREAALTCAAEHQVSCDLSSNGGGGGGEPGVPRELAPAASPCAAELGILRACGSTATRSSAAAGE